MELSFGAASHSVAGLVYVLVALLISTSYLRRNADRALFFATLCTIVWLSVIAAQAIWDQPGFYIRYAIEIIRNYAWLSVLYVIFGIGNTPSSSVTRKRFYYGASVSLTIIVMLLVTFIEGFFEINLVSGRILIVAQIALSLVGLMLLEQVWRNATQYGRSSIRYLTVGIGTMFGFDFFMYADALLFNQTSATLWDSRGIVNALVAPLVAVTMINSRKQPIEVQVSRQFVFHTGTLFIAGVYLLLISAGGYYLRVLGGDLGNAMQVIFVAIALIFFLLVISSRRVRARMMLFISKHFFNYKYDYRREWLKNTQILVDETMGDSISIRVIRSLAGLLSCQNGVIWTLRDDGHYAIADYWNHKEIRFGDIDQATELVGHIKQKEWIINLREYEADPTIYELIDIPDCMSKATDPWLIIPLFLGSKLYGLVLIGKPLTRLELNWENYDLIKVVARQACSFLAQSDTQEKLTESKQFEAVTRTSAFMLHDMKTIIAQLSLLVKNAEKHKTNPAFIEDMIHTTGHAVDKMSRMVQQISKPTDDEGNPVDLELNTELEAVISQHQNCEPRPHFSPLTNSVRLRADRNKLHAVIGHIVQNAQDATPKDGEITVSIKLSPGFAVVFIQDTGKGMSEDFMKNELFRPFKSTKGLTGMGIGVFQSREYVRQLGGTLDVTSQLGVGTCFTVKLPTIRK